MKKTIALVFLLLAGALAAPAFAADLPWIGSDAEAKEQARVSGKPLLLYLHADYCVWCHVMQQTTFGDSRVRLLATAYVLCGLDGDKDGKAYLQKFHVQKYPFQAVLDASGALLAAAPEYMDADKYARTLAVDLPSEALAKLEADQAAHPADLHTAALLTVVQSECGETVQAAHLFAKLSSASPAPLPGDWAAACHALGLADTLGGDDRAALKLFQKAVASAEDPRESVALHCLQAAAWKRLGHTDEARAELEAVRHFSAATKDEKKEAQKQEEALRDTD